MPKKPPQVPTRRRALAYVDGDKERFEERLHRKARSAEPLVPVMVATKGKPNRFTGMTTKAAVRAVKEERAGRAKKKIR